MLTLNQMTWGDWGSVKDAGPSCSMEMGGRGKGSKASRGAGVDGGPSRSPLREGEEVAVASVRTLPACEGKALPPAEDKQAVCLQKPVQAEPRARPS